MGSTRQILVQRFLHSVANHPDRPALRFSDRDYSYQQLFAGAHGFARIIADSGDQSTYVAILAERSFTAYAGILGTLLAGKAYMPLNPRFPLQRNHYILMQSQAGTMVVGGECQAMARDLMKQPGLSDRLTILELPFIAEETLEIPEIRQPAESPAYLLFTSGSTGNPKGVAVSNRNVTAYLEHLASMFRFSPEDRFTQLFDLTFDLSVHDMFVCWSAGACLCIPEDSSSLGISRYMKQMQPTIWFSVPSVAMMLDRMRLLKSGAFPSLRLSFFCGEALHVGTATAWIQAASASQVVNLYGPTETTIAICAYILPVLQEDIKSRQGVVCIGKPFPGHSYLMQGEADGAGVLCLSGPQVVEWYFMDEELSRQYFIEAGIPSKRYYVTGDLVAADPEGDLFFLGRADYEVKISGYRVNLLEIDHVIQELKHVEQAVTLYLSVGDNRNVLVTFVMTYEKKDDILDDIFFITTHCRQKLAPYMVPEKIIFVDEMPLTPNGKTDRQALAALFKEKYA